MNDQVKSKGKTSNTNISKEAIRLNQEGLKQLLFGKIRNAIHLFKKSIKTDDLYSDPYFNLGNIYIQKNDFVKSESLYEKAVGLNNNNPDYFFNLAVAKSNLNKIHDAIVHYQKTLELEPDNAKAFKFLGNCLKDLKNFNEAVKVYNSWRSLDPENPDPVFNKSLIHIRNGRFDIGWKLYEAGLRNNTREPFDGFYNETKDIWDGVPFDGTLLVYGEQGLGDQILFGTILPELLNDQKNIILKVDNRLKNLFRSSFPNITVVSKHDYINKDQYTKYISMGSLCKFYRKHTDDFMKSEFKSYHLNHQLPVKYNEQLKKLKNLKIGISWITFSTNNGSKRSLKDVDVARILNCSNNSYINLQYGDVSGSISNINKLCDKNLTTIQDLDMTNDLDNLIGVIKNCDLIITIDNTMAHLASSLGKQVWILLPYSADARWMEKMTATLWYENALLLRQSEIGNWESVIQTIELAFSNS